MYYVNENVRDLYRVFDQNDRSGYLRLDLNENPGGLPEEIIREAFGGITPEFAAQYPETRRFKEMLSQYLGTDPSELCLVNGSAEGIRYIIEAFTSENGRIVGAVPSYFMFQVYAAMYGRRFVEVPYNDDMTMDVGNIIREMTEETQLLVLLNPNNPMGNVYSDGEIERIMAAAEKNRITVLIDEAYHYFYQGTFIKYALGNEHVFVTRTFSKLFSMAGCRLGYVAGRAEGIEMIQKLCTPHNVNAFAMRLAETVIGSPGTVDKLISDFTEGRKYLIGKLDENGYRHIGEAGNFLFIKPKTDARPIVWRMKNEKKILIKAYDGIGELGTCLRVTTGAEIYMKEFVEALLELDK